MQHSGVYPYGMSTMLSRIVPANHKYDVSMALEMSSYGGRMVFILCASVLCVGIGFLCVSFVSMRMRNHSVLV
jgi:hypothetical protein